MERPLRTQAFAVLTGVTVRALHHYDRIGLLIPGRSASGYRLYGKRELERLEQITALRFIGVPLKQMRPLLDGCVLAEALPRQRALLEQKRRVLDEAIRTIQIAERAFQAGEYPSPAVLAKIIEVIGMDENMNWSQKYYSPEAQEAIRQRQETWTPEMRAKAEKDWRELFQEVEASLQLDPQSEAAQSLGRRWKALVQSFTNGNPEVAAGLNKLYADRSNWSAPAQEQMVPFSNPRVWQFMSRVLSCEALAR